MGTIVGDVILGGGQLNPQEEERRNVIIAKSTAMVVLFVASLSFGLLPMLLSKKFKWIKEDQTATDIKSSKIIVGLLSFGGGVLLCTTFMHLLPEVGESVHDLQEEHLLPESIHMESLLMCLGFFAMYFIEEVVHLYIHRRSEKQLKRPSDTMLVRTLSIRHSINNNKLPPAIKDPENISTVMPSSVEDPQHGGCGMNERTHSHMPIMGKDEDPVIISIRGLLIVLALSVHELFEGLAVGLESSAETVWYMFAAVSAHKLVIAFCVGVELVTTRTKPLLSFLYSLTFAIVSPIGIGIGLGLAGGEGASNSGLPSVILQGLACGTLLYVVFFEILQRDRAGLPQLLSTMIGFGLMFGFQFIYKHDHSHGHSHDHCHDDDDHN